MSNSEEPMKAVQLLKFVIVEFCVWCLLAGHSVISRTEALQRAKSLDLDLVEVNIPSIVLITLQVMESNMVQHNVCTMLDGKFVGVAFFFWLIFQLYCYNFRLCLVRNENKIGYSCALLCLSLV